MLIFIFFLRNVSRMVFSSLGLQLDCLGWVNVACPIYLSLDIL
jgi:hypothetical protein